LKKLYLLIDIYPSEIYPKQPIYFEQSDRRTSRLLISIRLADCLTQSLNSHIYHLLTSACKYRTQEHPASRCVWFVRDQELRAQRTPSLIACWKFPSSISSTDRWQHSGCFEWSNLSQSCEPASVGVQHDGRNGTSWLNSARYLQTFPPPVESNQQWLWARTGDMQQEAYPFFWYSCFSSQSATSGIPRGPSFIEQFPKHDL
jgi:hypothetical protein